MLQVVDLHSTSIPALNSAFDFTDPHSPLIADAGTDWLADTGATSHMTPHRHWFTTYQPHRVGIRLADHKVIYSTGCGSVRFQPVINGKPQRLFVEFHDVLHVPSLRSNLLSVLYLTRKKQYNVFINSACIAFKLQNRLLFTATINSNNAAHLDGQVVPPTKFAGRVTAVSEKHGRGSAGSVFLSSAEASSTMKL